MTNNNLGKYINAGALLPLDNLIDMNDIIENCGPMQTKEVVSSAPDGKTYTLITSQGFYLPMYRPSVFKKAGINEYANTPEEFIKMCGKLKKSGVWPYGTMVLPGNWSEGQFDLFIWVFGLGGHYAKNGLPTLNSPKVIQAITYLKRMFDAGYMPKETEKNVYRKMFAKGELGTLIDGPWMYGLSLSVEPAVKNDFKVTDLPFPTQRAAAFYESVSICSKTEHREEAADLIEYLCGPEQQKRVVKIVNFLTPRRDVLEDKDFIQEIVKENPWFEQYLKHTNLVPFNAPGIDVTKLPELMQIWYSNYQKVLYEGVDPAKAMNAAQKEALQLFEE